MARAGGRGNLQRSPQKAHYFNGGMNVDFIIYRHDLNAKPYL